MKEAENTSLDKANKASTRWDFVLVVDKAIKDPKLKKFIHNLKAYGLKIEATRGNKIPANIYLKLNLPPKAIEDFGNIYGIDIGSTGRNYISISTLSLNFAQTPLNSILDVIKYGEATNMERILIINEILAETSFGEDDSDSGLSKLINLGVIKAAYPLHDGSYRYEENDEDEELNDRQMLMKYWSNFTVWYKEQPLNLIQKYYGTEVAFYFAWLGFYNTMLIPAAIVGVICFILSIILLNSINHELVQEICSSDLTMCPLCHSGHSCIYQQLKNSCDSARFSLLFDNSANIAFAIFMSFWGTLFLNLWRMKENILKMRWAVETGEHDTKLRSQFRAVTGKKYSEVTGQMEPYMPKRHKMFRLTLSYGTSLFLVAIALLGLIGIITYRVTMAALIRMSNSKFLKLHAGTLLTCTGGILQVLLVKIYGTFYGPASERLTQLESPRTQNEFDNGVINKRYFLGFVNNYVPLFYIAFVKGRFYSPAHKPSIVSFETDICHVCSCLTALCIQLLFMMLLKSMAGNILTLIIPMVTGCFKSRLKKPVANTLPQWEEEFALYPSGRYLLTTEFMEMIVQYGFVTFFVAAFPLAPLCALINNTMELRLDALKLVTRYRRPIPRQTVGIGHWNDILKAINLVSTAINAFVLAFTSDFVAKQIYRYRYQGTLKGYIKSTLSVYDIADLEVSGSDPKNFSLCYYRALRYPPDHPRKYQLTSDYWYEIGIRLLCVIVFEHVVFILNAILAYFIQDLPTKVKYSIQRERNKKFEEKLKELVTMLKARNKEM